MKHRWTRSLSEHDRRDDRVLGAARGEHALLQVDAIDPVVPEDVVAVGLQETPNAVEIPVPFHPSQGHMGLPRSSLRGESEGLEGGRRWNVDGNESAKGHGVRSPRAGVFGSATNRPCSSKRPRRCPSRTAVRRILAATSPETESSAARSLTSSVPRVTAYAAA